MMTHNDAVVMHMLMTFNNALPVLSTKNDGHCHHSRMGVFPDPQSNNIEGLARETIMELYCRADRVWSPKVPRLNQLWFSTISSDLFPGAGSSRRRSQGCWFAGAAGRGVLGSRGVQEGPVPVGASFDRKISAA